MSEKPAQKKELYMSLKDLIESSTEEELKKDKPLLVVKMRDLVGDSHERLAEVVAHVRYSQEDKARWAKLIRDFNALFHSMGIQTWSLMRYRGISILKPPTDMWTYQELINEIKPDLIIETGSYCGGSALFLRDILNLIYPQGKIISIDIDHSNINEIARQPGIEFYLGDSVASETLTHVKAHIAAYKCERVMVILDSCHEEEHVEKEIELYSPLVSVGSMMIVEDTSNHPGPIAAVNSWSLRQIHFKKNLMGEKYMLTFCRDGFWEKII